jgi:aldehyde:ferredoxin oxidoreductase
MTGNDSTKIEDGNSARQSAISNLQPPRGGYAGEILEVDLTTRKVSTRPTAPYIAECLGGRALAAKIALDEMPTGIEYDDPAALIIIATGPLTGTLAPTTGRTVMASLGPRIYPKPWYTHSTIGGWFGPEIKYAGYDAIIVKGVASSPVRIEVTGAAGAGGKARIVEAADLWGVDARETQLRLKKRLGSETQILAIGQAGENRVRFATVQHAEENAAGHSGFGAVWGAKNLKAITARGTGGVKVAHPQALLDEVLSFGKFQPTPSYMATLPPGAADKRKPICSQACTFNCGVSNYGYLENGRAVPGQCVGGLAWVGEFLQGTKYDAGGMYVPPAPNYSLKKEAWLLELCNNLGLDVWFRLVLIPFFIRCIELGVTAIRGHELMPLDREWLEGFMYDLAHRRGLGDVFAEDLRRAMDILAAELPAELITLGHELEFGFGFPAHREGRFWDEEPLPFWVFSAMMYASESRDPTIGTHQSGLLLADWVLHDPASAMPKLAKVAEQAWGIPDAFEPTFEFERKAPVAVWIQNQHMLIDTLLLCDFAFPQLTRPIDNEVTWRETENVIGDLDFDRRILAAVTGMELTRDDLTRIAERGFATERLLLARAGRARPMEESLAAHFNLPCRADGTTVDAAGFSRLLDAYFAQRGYDLSLGWPNAETLAELGLSALTLEFEALRNGR